MVSDTNLIAQYEGLECMLAFVMHASDIKTATFNVHNLLFEKVQLNKENFKSMIKRIIVQVISKE